MESGTSCCSSKRALSEETATCVPFSSRKAASITSALFTMRVSGPSAGAERPTFSHWNTVPPLSSTPASWLPASSYTVRLPPQLTPG